MNYWEKKSATEFENVHAPKDPLTTMQLTPSVSQWKITVVLLEFIQSAEFDRVREHNYCLNRVSSRLVAVPEMLRAIMTPKATNARTSGEQPAAGTPLDSSRNGGAARSGSQLSFGDREWEEGPQPPCAEDDSGRLFSHAVSTLAWPLAFSLKHSIPRDRLHHQLRVE